jgi:hypothetical protein
MIDFPEYERRVTLAREAEAAGTSESFGVMVPWRQLALLLYWAKRGRTQGTAVRGLTRDLFRTK